MLKIDHQTSPCTVEVVCLWLSLERPSYRSGKKKLLLTCRQCIAVEHGSNNRLHKSIHRRCHLDCLTQLLSVHFLDNLCLWFIYLAVSWHLLITHWKEAFVWGEEQSGWAANCLNEQVECVVRWRAPKESLSSSTFETSCHKYDNWKEWMTHHWPVCFFLASAGPTEFSQCQLWKQIAGIKGLWCIWQQILDSSSFTVHSCGFETLPTHNMLGEQWY